MKAKKYAKVLAYAMSTIMALGVAQPVAFAAQATDISGHWAESTIAKWQEDGRISGYEDGTFLPEKAISRAEFVRLLNQTVGAKEKAEIAFGDVSPNDWFYNDVALAVGEGYTKGFEDGTFRPGDSVTRAQAATFVSTAAGLNKDAAGAARLTDANALPAWATDNIGAIISAGIMSGYPDGSFQANRVMTRAEAVSTLDRVLNGGKNVAKSDVLVEEAGTVLKDQTVEGNLIISEKVGNGDVTVENVTVKGDILVQGGGKNSVHLVNVTAGTIAIEKDGVRVSFEGETTATKVKVSAPSITLDSKNFKGKVGTITITGSVKDGSDITVGVPANALEVEAKVNVDVNADVEEVTIAKDAKDTKLSISSSAKVGTLTADGALSISGNGTIGTLEANVDGIKTTITPSKTKTADGVKSPSTTSGGGGGSSSSSSSSSSNRKTVKAVVITADKDITGVANGETVTVTLKSATADAKIYYTTDGTVPTDKSLLYNPSEKPTLTTTNQFGETKVVKATAVKSGMKNAAVTTKEIVFKANETVEVTTAAELTTAIKNNDIKTINVIASFEGDVTAERTGSNDLTIDFGEKVMTGNLSITANEVTNITLSGTAEKSIEGNLTEGNLTEGNLTITAPKATVENDVAITGIVTLNGVGFNSYVASKSQGTGIVMAGQGTLDLYGAASEAKVEVKTAAQVVLAGEIGEVNVTAPEAIVTVEGEVSKITVAKDAAGSTLQVTTGATLAALVANADITVVKGTGATVPVATGTAKDKIKEIEAVTVTFVVNGGVMAAPSYIFVEADGEKTVTLPTAPTKEGFTFDGWFTEDAAFTADTKVTKNITVTAKWTAKAIAEAAKIIDNKITFEVAYADKANAEKVTEAAVAAAQKLVAEGYTVTATKDGTITDNSLFVQFAVTGSGENNTATTKPLQLTFTVKEASKDASITGVTVNGTAAVVDSTNAKIYNVELANGTVLADLRASAIVVVATDSNATVATATTDDNGVTWKVEVTAEDGTTKVTYTIKATVAAAEPVVEYAEVKAATEGDLTSDGYTVDSVKKVNVGNLTVVQDDSDDSNVTITGKDLVKVTQADFPLEGFGNYTIPTEGISSTEFALIAWMVGDEPHIWIIGDKTTEFPITWEGVEYTINVEDLNWEEEEEVELNLVSVDKAATEDGYTFTVKAEGDDLGRLHVLLHTGLDASYGDIDGTSGKIEYLVLNASEDNVYGDEASKTKVTGFGVTASYVEATQTWTVTVNSETLQGKLGTSIELKDIGLLFYLSNEADRKDRSENIIASDFSVD